MGNGRFLKNLKIELSYDSSGCLHVYTEYYSFIKKNKTLRFATTQVNLEGIMLSENMSDRKILYVLIFGV